MSFFTLFFLSALCNIVKAQNTVPGQIIIDIKHENLPINTYINGQGIILSGISSLDTLNARFGVYAFEKLTDDSWNATRGMYLLRFPNSHDVNLVHFLYSSDTHIHLAGLCGFRYPAVIPSDYYFSQQWGLSRIKCPEAWRYTNGKSSIIIQIIDGGTDYGHPDLMKNIWQNLSEDADGDGHTIEWNAVQNRWILDPGDTNHVDNDNNGFADDLVGWDFYSNDKDPQTEASFPWADHGTCTASIAAAVTSNQIEVGEATWICNNDINSIAGTSWFSKIMIARCGGVYDEDFDIRAIRAINYARNKGAKIINMSWVSLTDDDALHATLDSAYSEGILLIASANNHNEETPQYPAAYMNVIAVAGTDSADVKAHDSNYGSWVDICAPYTAFAAGRDWSNWNYYCYHDSFAGTSASAPFVAGVAALLWSCNPLATNIQVKNAILSTADDIYNIPGNYPYIGKLGSGRVNALEAVKVFRPYPPPPGDCNTNFEVEIGDVTALINYLFQSGPPSDPVCVGEVTGNGVIDAGDVVYLIGYLFRGGNPPIDGCQ
jgi:hypothetical protein